MRAAIVLMLLLPLEARALSINFEDLMFGTTYTVGDTFSSGGISFEVVSFGSPTSVVFVDNFGYAPGSGMELFMGSGIGLKFGFPAGTREVSLNYGEYHTYSGIAINGETALPAGGLIGLDGTSVGGVSLSVSSAGASGNQGQLTAQGQINSFVIGGTEFAIDNVVLDTPLLGDFDRNGRVGGNDFLLWQRGASPIPRSEEDIFLWQIYFGNAASPLVSESLAVPEPSSLLLLMITLVTGRSARCRVATRLWAN